MSASGLFIMTFAFVVIGLVWEQAISGRWRRK